MAINEESGIRSGDATVLMQKVAENSAGRQLAFDFINDNVDAILQSRYKQKTINFPKLARSPSFYSHK